MKKRIVIIGIGNVGFSVLKELYASNNAMQIVAIDRVFPKHLEEFIEKNNASNNVQFIQSDVTDEEAVDKISRDDRLDVIDVLICTVGILSSATDFEGYRKEFYINFFGNIAPIKALIKKIPENKNGRIIVLSSISGNIAPTDPHSYSPSKWALENFSSSLRQEYSDKGIFIDIIRPFNILNKYSEAFKIDKGITPESVARRVLKQVNLSLNDASVSGKNCFVPWYLLTCRFIERVFPGIFNHYFGLKKRFIRRRVYRRLVTDRVMVTDVNSSLGEELAQLYALNAKELIICGNEEESLKRLHKKLNETNSCQVISKKIDISSSKTIMGMLKNLDGNVDLLVNTSNKYLMKPVDDTLMNDYVKIMDSNFLTPVLLTQDLISHKKMCKVVNVLPDDAIYGRSNHSAYGASKAALWTYIKSMRRQNGNTIQFLEVFLNNVTMKFSDLVETKKIAHRIVNAERKGRDVLMISNKTRLNLLLQNFAYPIFKKTKLNK